MKEGLQFNCYGCKASIKEAGALLFSPPMVRESIDTEACSVIKYHICISCFDKIISYVKTLPK